MHICLWLGHKLKFEGFVTLSNVSGWHQSLYGVCFMDTVEMSLFCPYGRRRQLCPELCLKAVGHLLTLWLRTSGHQRDRITHEQHTGAIFYSIYDSRETITDILPSRE
jgi:hypothetical protein